MRRLIISGIMLLWLGSLAALLFHDPTRTPPPAVSLRPNDSPPGAEEWWGVYMQGHKVGFVRHSMVPTGTGLAFQEESVLHLTTLGEKQVVRTSAFGTLTTSFELENVELSLEAGPTRFTVQAAAHGNELWVTIESGGNNSRVTKIPLASKPSLSIGMRRAAMRAPLEAGRITRGVVFDPLTRSNSTLTLTVQERQPLPAQPDLQAWRIDEEWRDVKSVLWVDDQGRLLREEGPMGLLAIREDKAQATALADSTWDAVDAVSIPVDPPIEEPRTRETLRVRISGISLDRIPPGDGQSVEGNELLIRRADLESARSYTLPYAAGDHAQELAATETLQADDPRISKLTETILGDQRDALAATRLLLDWVYRYLKKIPTASLPNALEILDTGQGDCNEHAVLFTALARAAGIPARVVSGTVYGADAFLYHAWSEVWLGRWIAVDAALNQVPADATHIRLAVGDRDEHLMMMGIIGSLRIEILRDDEQPT